VFQVDKQFESVQQWPFRTLLVTWESPFPAISGMTLRHQGILQELSRYSEVDLIVMSRVALTEEQRSYLASRCCSITEVARLDVSTKDKIRAVITMVFTGQTWHNSIVSNSFAATPKVAEKILSHDGLVYLSHALFGGLLRKKKMANVVLDQHNEEVQLWKVQAKLAKNPLKKAFVSLNHFLARKNFAAIYANAGMVVSVCDEDMRLTQEVAPKAKARVIENGVDASYFSPDSKTAREPHQMIFTGTSVERNMIPIREFVQRVLPKVIAQVPDSTFVLGGNFDAKAQAEFADQPNIHFSGKVSDIRPVLNRASVFVAPFSESFGSKLKVSQALSMGLPVVSTPAGVRGFDDLEVGVAVEVCDGDQAFADKVVELMLNPSHATRIGTKGREYALAKLDWPVLGRRLDQLIREMNILPRKQ
jgi:glycosyltransferase involved in cell wall biosynthesis